MAKKKKKKTEWLLKLLLLIGGIYILKLLFAEANKPKEDGNISGLPSAKRDFIDYTDRWGDKVFFNELSKCTNQEQGEIIRLIIAGREAIDLSMPLFKSFKSSVITGELRKGQWRIFLYKLDEENYVLLNFFKKKSNDTPSSEIQKAEKRIAEYEGQQNG